MRIEFTQYKRWDSKHMVMMFEAKTDDGGTIICRITWESLSDDYGCNDQKDAATCFDANKASIYRTATNKMERCAFEADGAICIYSGEK